MNAWKRLNITLYLVQVAMHFFYAKYENLVIHQDKIFQQMILNILNCCLTTSDIQCNSKERLNVDTISRPKHLKI